MEEQSEQQQDMQSLSIVEGNESASKLSECSVHFSNPFINEDFVDHINKVSGLKAQRFETKKGLSLVTKHGETLSDDNNALIMHQRRVDREEFTKVFANAMKGIGLSRRSSSLILYIAAQLNKDDTYVNLHQDILCELMDISKATFYRALFDLIQHNVIARTRYPYKFYINPLFIFNGNRLTVVQQYIKSYDNGNGMQYNAIETTNEEFSDEEENDNV